jgi:hypothetical protein
MANNAVNYVFLTATGTLTVNTTGFPVPSETPHIRLAVIETGTESDAGTTGTFDFTDIDDHRGTAMIAVAR